ncbi:Gp49 family protein [Castellaniella caeni]|uniref:Gp49 family protein n=1 Tax=Castellaniella caeni TaxID=266123 RepID=UPI000C9FCD46|nr:Gp49 family protein [Castellaniella caeni]
MHATRMPPTLAEEQVVAENYVTGFEASARGTARYLDGLEDRHIDALRLLTICLLTLRNGFVVTGEAFCSDPLAFDAETGRKLARGRALDKVWPLLGYALCSELARPVLTEADAAADLAGTPRPGQQG